MKWLLIMLLLALAAPTAPGDVTFQSSAVRTHLLELYTSEGCSSCPPAEEWFSKLRESPRLWKEIVPVAFHVDYWDGLGWPDRFASKAHTARQRAYAASWGSRTVYTPGFVLDGREWQDRALDRIPASEAGLLSATIRERTTVAVAYTPTHDGKWEVHVAVLGFGIDSDVRAGENSGRTLRHDFVVLAHGTKPLSLEAGVARAEIQMPALSSGGELGLAVWISEAGKLQPLQAVGGKL